MNRATREIFLYGLFITLSTVSLFGIFYVDEMKALEKAKQLSAEQTIEPIKRLLRSKIAQLKKLTTYYVATKEAKSILSGDGDASNAKQRFAELVAGSGRMVAISDRSNSIIFQSKKTSSIDPSKYKSSGQDDHIDITVHNDFIQIVYMQPILHQFSDYLGIIYNIEEVDVAEYRAMGLESVTVESSSSRQASEDIFASVMNFDIDTSIVIRLNPADNALAKLQSSRRVKTAASLLILLLMIGTVFYLIGRSITRPIDQLSSHMSRRGSESLAIGKCNGSIMTLANQFEYLKEDVGKKKENMRRLVVELKEDKKQLRKDNNLLQVVTHDIATPITVIKGACEIATSIQEEQPERVPQLIGRIQKAVSSVEQITTHVRDMLAIRSGKKMPALTMIDLDDVVADTKFFLGEKMTQKQLRLHYVNHCPEERIVADRIAFSNNVFNNIMSNAIKFSPRGGTIYVESKISDDRFHITISDEGMGVPASILPELFQPDCRTSRPGTEGEEGTGFGLPLAKAYMDSFGGKIEITTQTSGSETGTTFHLYLKHASADGDALIA